MNYPAKYTAIKFVNTEKQYNWWVLHNPDLLILQIAYAGDGYMAVLHVPKDKMVEYLQYDAWSKLSDADYLKRNNYEIKKEGDDANG